MKNSSATGTWTELDQHTSARKRRRKTLTEEMRVHPVPLEEHPLRRELRIAGNGAEKIVTFSGSHLHGTVPNRSGETRFSVDFRLMHISKT